MVQTDVTLPVNSTAIFMEAANKNFFGFVNPATFGRSTVETLAPVANSLTGATVIPLNGVSRQLPRACQCKLAPIKGSRLWVQ